ncbi:MAG: hypothetical protein KDE22_01545 [Rhodobacterales bacterium]|nr:hypothetical protein [Rhodobacterales bacterium]
MADRTFTITKDGDEIPVIYTDDVLSEFRENKVALVDAEIETLRDRLFDRDDPPADAPRGADTRLGIVGPLIMEALDEGKETVVAQCVLWLAARHPEITGLEIFFGQFRYVSTAGADGASSMVH